MRHRHSPLCEHCYRHKPTIRTFVQGTQMCNGTRQLCTRCFNCARLSIQRDVELLGGTFEHFPIPAHHSRKG